MGYNAFMNAKPKIGQIRFYRKQTYKRIIKHKLARYCDLECSSRYFIICGEQATMASNKFNMMCRCLSCNKKFILYEDFVYYQTKLA